MISADVEIEVLSGTRINELKELISVFEDVFEMKNFTYPHDEQLLKLLLKDNFTAIVAKLKGTIIGGLTVYTLDQYYSPKPLAYIFDLAILIQYQRQGLGKMLIAFTNNYFAQRGFEEVFVQADKVDKYALDFYRGTKPTNEEKVVHFYYTL